MSDAENPDRERLSFYVASPFEWRMRVKDIIATIEDAGHRVTVDWTDHLDESTPGEFAAEDVEGVRECDVFVLLANSGSRGSHVELGVAITTGSTVHVVGPVESESTFYHHPAVDRLQSIEDVYDRYLRTERDQ